MGGKRDQGLARAMAIVFGGEGNVAVVQLDETVVGDGDAMSIPAQVVEHLTGTTEGRLGIDHPLLTTQAVKQTLESTWFGQMSERAMKREVPLLVSPRELFAEETAKETREYPDRQKEVLATTDPALVIKRETTTRDHAMKVRMMAQILAPGMEDGEEANMRAEMLGVGSDL